MVNLIYQAGGEKHCRPITTLADLTAACNSPENVRNWNQYRATGDNRYKHALVQVSYNCQVAEGGLLKGCQTVSPFFFYDIDCRDKQECRRIMAQLLDMKAELGLVEVAESASYGVHAVGRRQAGRTILESQVRLSMLTKTEMDTNNKENNRVVFHGPINGETTPLIDEALLLESLSAADAATEYVRLKEREANGQEEVPPGAKKANKHYRPWEDGGTAPAAAPTMKAPVPTAAAGTTPTAAPARTSFPTTYHGIPFADILKRYWELNNRGFEPTEGDRDTLTFQLACDLRHICGKSFEWLDQVIPCYDGFPLEEKRQKIRNALSSKYEGFPLRLKGVLDSFATTREQAADDEGQETNGADATLSALRAAARKLPMGVRDSIEAVGPQLAMPVVTAICPCIGALATGVRLDVHGRKRGLNLIAYIVGDFASGKGDIDPVVDAWMSELRALDTMYLDQEEEWRAKKRAAKNQKQQPEEPVLPVRCLTLNNTVANLAERLANTGGKHAFSFTPEADTVAQKWKTAISDFSVMLRQSYDGSRYEREARSVDAVNVHIEHLLWNVTMCGTPDALYRVVPNYTDGFLSRIAVASTPDNTFMPLEDKPRVLTEIQRENIQKVAHLLPLMQGEVVLPKLERRGREWLERIRMETMKNDDRVRARLRLRVCVTAQRMTCCLMLCRVCEQLIQAHGLAGAEKALKQDADLWRTMVVKAQTPQLLEIFEVIADSLLHSALYYFRARIENALSSRDYASTNERLRIGSNDTIYAQLDMDFSFESALQHSVSMKGAASSHNQVKQMLKNWKRQGLIVSTGPGRYRKLNGGRVS